MYTKMDLVDETIMIFYKPYANFILSYTRAVRIEHASRTHIAVPLQYYAARRGYIDR